MRSAGESGEAKVLSIAPMRDDEFRFIAGIAQQRTGIVLGPQKRDLVYSRLSKRLRKLGLTSFGDYCRLLAAPEGEDERDAVVNAITTNLTRLFREPHHFEHLAQLVLRDIARVTPTSGAERRRLRIWSAGCSTGEEAYSIAMTILVTCPEATFWDARILATDIDTDVLERARAARYDRGQLEYVPPAMLQEGFVQSPGSRLVGIASKARDLVAFKPLNLIGAWPMKGPFDAIFCRNVLIYFDRRTQAGIIDRMADLLPEGGTLYLGHSESLHGLSDRFELAGRTIFRRVA
jgi:chemotaxis protein methyltransferase CheR